MNFVNFSQNPLKSSNRDIIFVKKLPKSLPKKRNPSNLGEITYSI